MNYSQKLKYHYRPKKGWVNDPNGLVYYNGYYHVFYQHAPDFEIPGKQAMHWGHARTKDFITWEELPIALFPDKEYDSGGCWSGTAIVSGDVLYLFYASIHTPKNSNERIQSLSVAYSNDGITFKKHEANPIIPSYPDDGGPDFRDPAVCYINGTYYCVMASGHPVSKKGRLLLYRSDNLISWDYVGIMSEWESCRYTECPSFISFDGQFLLSLSVCPLDKPHYFNVMLGSFENEVFKASSVAELDKGPDQYAGQIFRDHLGRNILISWLPGWKYAGYADRDIGCMSIPREIKIINGKICAYPIEELRHLLTDCDEAVKRVDNGFIIERTGRDPVIYEGKIDELKILRDGYIVEVFVNGGEEVYTALL